METALRITIEEMLDAATIAEIGADHADICLCVTRICNHLGKLKDDNARLREACAEALRRVPPGSKTIAPMLRAALGQ